MDDGEAAGRSDAEECAFVVRATLAGGAVVVAVRGENQRAGIEAVGACGLATEVVKLGENAGGCDAEGGAAASGLCAVRASASIDECSVDLAGGGLGQGS